MRNMLVTCRNYSIMNKISQVIKSGMCAGCGFCAASSKEMEIDNQGYFRPKSFIDDELSVRVCPGRRIAHNNNDGTYNLLWGPIVSCDVGYANSQEVRHLGSSGGVLTALMCYLIDTNKVDAVIQIGVSDDNPIRNRTNIFSSREDIISCAGSRYSPSSPLTVIRSLLDNGKRYAIIGKPCDIAAMRTLVNHTPKYREQFPYLLSFMCAGIPSEKGTKQILRAWNLTPEQLISFRYRGDGWPGLTKAITSAGEEFTMTYNESWGSILNRHLQSRCKLCADGIGEAADIVCGDAWHASSNGYPSFEEEAGRSLTIARTQTGRQLLDQALAAKAITLTHYDIKELKHIQPYQANRKQTTQVRRWAVMLLGGKAPTYKGYHLGALLLRSPIKLTVKAFCGTLIRKLRGRI